MTTQAKAAPKGKATGKGTKTNPKKGSLVKTVVLEDVGKWVAPASGAKFYIDEDAKFPEISFEIETDFDGPITWSWVIVWAAGVSGLRESTKRGKVLKTFSAKGTITENSKRWVADLSKQTLGGVLSVKAEAGQHVFKRSVYILGKNPTKEKVTAFLETQDGVKGLDTLLEQESKFKNFINADGLPVVSFDSGYGMTQMTNPAPTYEQVWSWKENIKAGASLYRQKQSEAKAHLSQRKRTYTDEQLKLETWTRWNGGVYHVWDEEAKQWKRNPTWLCDRATGNIGWNTTQTDNQGKTEKELHDRDSGQYAKPPKKSERSWDYSGVCYADHLSH
jgi:hypothetical protein